eukprot:1158582-Pelagomonas_calceolata.AAC.3
MSDGTPVASQIPPPPYRPPEPACPDDPLAQLSQAQLAAAPHACAARGPLLAAAPFAHATL